MRVATVHTFSPDTVTSTTDVPQEEGGYDDRDRHIIATALYEYAGTPDLHQPGTANERAIELVDDVATA